jgi:TonB family protein
MKKFSLILLIAFLISCSERTNDVEIIENIDAKFLTENEVDQEPGTDEQIDKLQEDLKKIVAEVTEDEDKPIRVLINHRVYLGADGKIRSIKSLYSENDFKNFNTNYPNYENVDKVTEVFAKYASDWYFNPALKENKPVNFRTDLRLPYIAEKDGSIKESFVLINERFSKLSKLEAADDVYYVAVEEMPSPIGGMTAIQKRITYPEQAKREGVQGRVFVKAYINEQGAVDKVELLKGIGAGCDSVAMNAIQETKFTPGKQRGEPVKVQVSIPIVFKLQ